MSNIDSNNKIKNTLINQDKENNNDSHSESSIKEIFNKTRINLLLSKNEKLLNAIKEDIDSNLIRVNNPDSLYNYLISIHNFKQYIVLNNFEPKTIIDSFRLGKYVKLRKNFKLFNQGDKTDSFYLIISGTIGLSINLNSLKSNTSKEINSIKSGTYFGEWGFIFKINRTVSAYAKEDTLLLKFDKNCFKEFYYHNIIGSENISKKFVLNHINTLKKLGISAFNQYYREIKKIYCVQGTPVFSSGEKANSFYLIFKGSCCLKKGLYNLVIKDVGDLIGIESLFKDEYETTIYTHSDDVVLFKFVVNTFTNLILNDFRKEFDKYYQNQKNMIELWEENYKKYKNKYKLNFFNLLQNAKTNKIKNSKILSKIKLNELSKDKNKKKEENYASPRKMNINFYPSKISLNLNKSESMKFYNPKLNIKQKPYKNIKNEYIFDKISNSPNTGVTIRLNYNKEKNLNKSLKYFAKRVASFNSKNKQKIKKNYSYFADEEKEFLPAYKKINLDNHFSYQNFKLKKKRIISALNKYSININNVQKQKERIKINCDNIYIPNEKFEKAMKFLTDNLKKSEIKEKEKKQNISNIIENEKNQNLNNNDVPIIIIRNYSMLNDPLKFI